MNSTYLDTVVEQLKSCGAVRLNDASRFLTDHNYESSLSNEMRDAVEDLFMPEDGSEGEYDVIEKTGKLTKSQLIAVASRLGLSIDIQGIDSPTGGNASDEVLVPSESQYQNDTEFLTRK